MLSHLFNETLTVARKDIFKFCEMLNMRPTPQQHQLLEIVQKESTLPFAERKKHIAVKSGQGAGKTACVGVVALWRVIRHVDAMCIATAPTQRQTKDQLLGELRRTVQKAVPELQQIVEIDSYKLTIVGRKNWGIKTVPANRPENVQGYHHKHLTYVFDEASGIDRSIWETVEGTMTNDDALLVAIGNPNRNQTAFHDCFHLNRDFWHTLTWNAEDSSYVNREKIKEHERLYGRESDFFRVRVLGEFPRMDPDCIMASEDVEACTRLQQDHLAREPLEDHIPMRQVGIDLARYGADESVLIFRRGRAVIAEEVYVKREPNEVIARAFAIQQDLGWNNEDTYYVFDAGGIGQGVAHMFYDANKNVLEFHSNGVPQNQDEFCDRVSEAYFYLRKLTLERSIYLPKDERMISQMVSRKYKMIKGKIRIESKQDYKDRIGTEEASSPDRADALVMAFYAGAVANAQVTRHQGKARSRWI